MGSTGEHDRKRRHFSSVSPTSAAKKHWIVPCSEDRKLDATVLQFQNQKLLQQLEVQKVEYTALQNKFCQLKDKGCDFSDTLSVVDSSWKELVEKLEALAANSRASANGRFNDKNSPVSSETSIQLWEATNNLAMEVKNLRSSLSNLHSKQRSSLYDLQRYRDEHAKNKAEVKCLSEELEGTFVELEESNRNLIALKAQRNSAHGAVFPSPTLGSKHVAEDKARDEQKELQDMEGTLKEFLDLSSNRLVELKSLYEDRIKILKKLAVLQVEKDSFLWREREVNLKVELADIPRRASLVAESRIDEMEKELQKRVDEKTQLDKRLEDALRESGRREIIAEFKEMVLSFPKDMECIQSQLNHFKGSPSEIHSMRAEVQYLSNILERKKTELGVLSGRSAEQTSEIQKLQGVVHEVVGLYCSQNLTPTVRHWQNDPRDLEDVMELRDLEYKAWSGVQCLKSSLDEHSLELRVKAANEAEAISQQRLAAAEAEIADLRQKLEVSKRDICRSSEVLKSKHEEGEAYLSEIETIGQAYEDMQTQNRQLLQQVTERDDYNIKLVMETTKNRQLQETLRMEVLTMHQEMQQASESMNFYNLKVSLLEDQLRIWSEQIGKLLDDEAQASVSLESAKKRLMDAHKESQHLGQSLDERESKLETSRIDVSDLQIEMESERFDQKRIDDDIEILTRKVTYLQVRREGSSVIEKLQQEIKEYKGILKCSVCHEREKQ
ncbi:E3 ubiquitin-protein ligase BRE1-like 1 [Acorus gramineus]|uniref:E3 ubiquitin protein ligase n=1 Tax=Acorus gramineus TaxID=55184 RepID=A0AAV9ABJ8_ACOGR|nr:E3 ubiquitin-protein ligase BRE1-like 1 [Acorus gramineus]